LIRTLLTNLVVRQNGSVAVNTLDSLLSWDDVHYLNDHPPEYVNGYVDSGCSSCACSRSCQELNDRESIMRAVADIAARPAAPQDELRAYGRNTLYALRFAPADTSDALAYYLRPVRSTGHRRSGMSSRQILGSSLAGWARSP
jgi:hypothetical protein